MSMAKVFRRSLVHNTISYAGAGLALLSAILLAFLLIIEIASSRSSAYIGIATFLILPSTLALGLIVIPIGMGVENYRRRKAKDVPTEVIPPPYPVIDLNLKRHQRLFVMWAVSSVLVLVLLAWASYRGYEYTESVTFCGETCHQVMKPEYVAYSTSPHARVQCASCHIGHGASWFVRSKLSGANQVLAVLFDTYPRPIPTPIENLRPAREVCEQCHWPEKFFGDRAVTRIHVLPDEKNSDDSVSLVMRTGGGGERIGVSVGIHWHTDPDIEVSYIAADEKREVIPWVAVREKDGSVVEYVLSDAPLSDTQVALAHKRVMDCIDCHNRPTHRFSLPEDSIDELIALRRVDQSIPYLRKVTVEAVRRDYSSKQDAAAGISSEIKTFYRDSYPQVLSSKADAIDRAVEHAVAIYTRNVFPEMGVEWATYHDNLGHKHSRGCFRCHDGKHVSSDGRVIRLECNICHSIPQPADGISAGLYPLLLAEPENHREPGWIPGHAKAYDSSCQGCHSQDFCNNKFCHGQGWLKR